MTQKKEISLNNGIKFFNADNLTEKQLNDNWDVIISFMDAETRETVNTELAPCSHRSFLRRYLELATEDLIIG